MGMVAQFLGISLWLDALTLSCVTFIAACAQRLMVQVDVLLDGSIQTL